MGIMKFMENLRKEVERDNELYLNVQKLKNELDKEISGAESTSETAPVVPNKKTYATDFAKSVAARFEKYGYNVPAGVIDGWSSDDGFDGIFAYLGGLKDLIKTDPAKAKDQITDIANGIKKDISNGIDMFVNELLTPINELIKKQPLPVTNEPKDITSLKKAQAYADLFKNRGCPAEIIGPSKRFTDCYVLAVKSGGKIHRYMADPMGIFGNEMPKIIEFDEKGELTEGIHEEDIPRLDTPEKIRKVLIKPFLDLMKFGVDMTDAKVIRHNRQIYAMVKTKEWANYVAPLVSGKDAINIAVTDDNNVALFINGAQTMFVGMEKGDMPVCVGATANNGQTPVATKPATTVKESVFSDEEKAEIMKVLDC